MSRGTRSGSKDSKEMVGFSKEEIDTLVQDTVDAAIRNTTTLFNQKLRDLQERHDKEMEELRGQLTEEKEEVIKLRAQIRETTLAANDLEQYSRRSHIRIHGLSLTAGTDCKGAVAAFIRQRVKDRQGRSLEVNADDFDAAHPLPLRRANPPVEHQAAPKERIPAIIVRFFSRDKRDLVLSCRRSLKDNHAW
ncbi:hypothetical protein CAPTEDRAFT_208819 [Capitella teleta]|uniref:Uncharacterized protein n=1 Tax=Capitella teleta TaxID=283909 RepID=R7V1D7_CAPTE|nr:hypothetical protein CAPTEDRAFT_208819 [Capitella teleta]|eukprot:ELU12364.1 hypothetical protein CAPTEDRAFT_208819 [Capitella teleta]